jgi:hypothetical protein
LQMILIFPWFAVHGAANGPILDTDQDERTHWIGPFGAACARCAFEGRHGRQRSLRFPSLTCVNLSRPEGAESLR